MLRCFFILLLFCTFNSFSQTKPFNITGQVVSGGNQEPLESATIYLERVKDSSLVSYTISDKDGAFSLESTSSDTSLRLNISYIGFKSVTKVIPIDKEHIELNTIPMVESTNELDAVILKSRAPITIKKDTLEFNVKSFKTKKDANVEDLLKVLPGVEVDETGAITVNGKPVNQILVNGKPFFGNDPTITTRNLTKEIIEKVQVVDTKTKAEAFTGEEGDGENRTINLTIKEENNKGVFGRASGGLGTNDRYEYAGMFNRFDNDQRISVLLGGNNINSPGFSFGEIRKMFGGGNSIRFNSDGSFAIDGRSFGGGEGITTSNNSGLNYADKFSETTDISADYFYSGSSSENRTSTQRENILPDSRFFTISESSSISDNYNHSANMEFDVKVDSTLLINIEPSFSYSKTKTGFSRDEETRDETNTLSNTSTTNSIVENFGKNFRNDLNITKRYGSKGAYLRFSLDNEFSSRETDDFLQSETNIFGDNPESIVRDQYKSGDNNSTNFSSRIYYNIPILAKELFLNIGYRYSRNKRTDKQSTFDKDGAGDFSIFNEDLSTDFEYVNALKQPEVSINFRNDTWSARFRTSYLFRTLENKDLLRPQFNITRDFEAIELRSNFRYRFSQKSSLRLGYNLNNDAPRLSQLQAFQNVSNPLNTVIGNPNLEPTNRHTIYFSFNAFDFQKQTGFFAYFNANFINNQVVRNTVVNANFVRETTFTNVNGTNRINGNLSYSKSFKVDSLKTVKVGVGTFANVNRSINFNNGIQYASNNTTVTPNVYVALNWKDVLEIRPRYRMHFSKNVFDIEAFEDRAFMYHDLSISTATFLPKHFEWRNEIMYNYNPNIAPGFQKSSWFWNATLAYSMLKDKATLTLKAYDILNQNTNARRTANQDYIQDSQSTVLEQYFMLSFSWKFNSLGKKGETGHDGMFYMH